MHLQTFFASYVAELKMKFDLNLFVLNDHGGVAQASDNNRQMTA